MKTLFMGLLATFTSCVQEEVKEIRVWDQEFNKIQVVTDHKKLGGLNAFWESRKEVSLEHRPSFSHKIDIVLQDGKSTRWLYAPEGYITVLTKSKTPIYQIADPEKFRAFLIPSNK